VDKLVKYLVIIQARISSSRLPAKMMMDLSEKTLLQRVYEIVKKSKLADKIVIATSEEKSDDLIELKAKKLGFDIFRGSLNNVLERFYECAKSYKAQNIIRICGDSPVISYKHIDKLIEKLEANNCEYCGLRNSVYGMSPEVFTFESLENAYLNYRNEYDTEHVTPYIIEHSKTLIEEIEEVYQKPEIRATIDTLEDYIRMEKYFFYCEDKKINADIDTYLEYVKKQKIIFE
jgi:spore coat polysaccharide biosynthesis protein SpsF